jgi:uncharacterized membrane protein YqjE
MTSAAKEPALLSLVRELVDALGALVAGHLRLARAELGGDARRFARRAALLGVAAAFGFVGYGLACLAAGLALAPVMGAPLAFLALGGLHVVGASIGLGVLLARAPRRPLDESLTALDQTFHAVAALRPSPNGASTAPAVGGATP